MVPWHSMLRMFVTKKRDGKPRMISGQLNVVHVKGHQVSVFPNTSLSSYASDLQ